MSARLGFVIVSLLLVPSSAQLKKETKNSNAHPGTIVDAYAHTGILAKAHAYGSEKVESREDCPVYEDPLDHQSSDSKTGAFTFNIPKDKSGYLAVYCQPGYFSRTETTNDNSRDGSRVQPDPIKLFPLMSKLPAPVTLAEAAFVAIATDLDGMTSNFNYYEKASPKAFASAVEENLRKDRDLVEAIKSRKPTLPETSLPPRPKRADIANTQVAYVAIATDLDNARSNFKYYGQVDKGEPFGDAYIKFSRTDKMIIDRIRERTMPFLSPATIANASASPQPRL